MNECFDFHDDQLSDEQRSLLRDFFSHLAKKYKMEISEDKVKFKESRIGLSPVKKIFVITDDFFPFFIKMGDASEIQRESRNYGKAKFRMPPLSIPPHETYISNTSGIALIAFQSITGKSKHDVPGSLFNTYHLLSQYDLIEIIDEIYQVALSELHGFERGPILKEIEYVEHDIALFSRQAYKTTSEMVLKYNKLVSKAYSPLMPHGHVHGDLHCNNILLGRGNVPVIIDFAMLREEGCLLCDFAELEISILVTSLFSDFSETVNHARSCYRGESLFDNFGVNKFSRCVRVIRSNLFHSFYESCAGCKEVELEDVTYVYQMLLLRYLCSYSWVVHETMEELQRRAITNFLSELFLSIHARTAKLNSKYQRKNKIQ